MHKQQALVPAPVSRTPMRFSWMGGVALLAGVLLFYMYSTRPVLQAGNLAARVIYLGVGTVLCVWGLQSILAEIFPRMGGSKRDGWTGYHVRIPREGAIFLGILVTLFVGALVGRSNLLILMFGLLAGPFVLNGSVTLTMLKRIRVARNLPERPMAGQTFSVDLVVANDKRVFSSWMLEVRDSYRNGRGSIEPVILFARVPPRGERAGCYQVALADRGAYDVGPVQVSSRFALGLMERVADLGLHQQLIVYPRIGHMTLAWRHSSTFSDDLVEQRRSRKGVYDDEFHQLREYRSGDNPRAIHWRTSARLSSMMIREFHQNRNEDLLLVVDLWQPESARPDDRERVERTIRFAATACAEQALHVGESGIDVTICGKAVSQWAGHASGMTLDPLLELFALAEAGPAKDTAREAAKSLERVNPGTTRCILLTTRELPQEIVASLPRHMQVVAADSEAFDRYFIEDEPPVMA